MTVIEGGDIKYKIFSSKNSYRNQNGYKINVLLPMNIFNFSGSNVTVEGNLETQLGNGDDVSRKLASGNGPEGAAAAPFKLNIALTVRKDSAPPPGYYLVSLLAMAGMVIMTFRKRRAHGKNGHY